MGVASEAELTWAADGRRLSRLVVMAERRRRQSEAESDRRHGVAWRQSSPEQHGAGRPHGSPAARGSFARAITVRRPHGSHNGVEETELAQATAAAEAKFAGAATEAEHAPVTGG